jgi:hypothetical protein
MSLDKEVTQMWNLQDMARAHIAELNRLIAPAPANETRRAGLLVRSRKLASSKAASPRSRLG